MQATPQLDVQPVIAERFEDLAALFRTGLARVCWDMEPRQTAGLLAYHEGQPVGWVSIGPRSDYPRIEQSRALQPLDDLPVWAIPCVYVHPAQRGQGIAVALLQAAVQHAGRHGAPAVEGYPCDPTGPLSAEEAFYGTVAMFTRAGFEVARPPLPGLPTTWTPRYTMRAPCLPTPP